MKKRFGLYVPWNVRTKNFGKDFLGSLHQPFGPARLLRFEAVHVPRQPRRALNFGKIHELPALQLRAIRKVGVLRERIVLPAPGGIDGRAAPDSRGAVEIEES